MDLGYCKEIIIQTKQPRDFTFNTSKLTKKQKKSKNSEIKFMLYHYTVILDKENLFICD